MGFELRLTAYPRKQATVPTLRVAQYVRMSTEHQQYSSENQSCAIADYARLHGMQVVRTFADHGKSGLSLAGRSALKALLEEVQRGCPDFKGLLVYDVSRWGRFQDADESAFYEYVLRQAGIPVHYCAEPFSNDGSLPSALVKTLKRTMAGEYSRELSVKVFVGQSRLTELGFRQGALPGYGLRRHLLDYNGNFKQVLEKGERKSIQTDRVVLAAGPPFEVALVRWMFAEFTESGRSEIKIAEVLNGRGVPSDLNRPWTRKSIQGILTNPKYTGRNVYNRESFKLRSKRVTNPPEMWIQKLDAFEALVAHETFEQAQKIILERRCHLTDKELLERLRALVQKMGSLSGIIIDQADDMPPTSVYKRRFGSLCRAYSLIGWSPNSDYSYVAINRSIRQQHNSLVDGIVEDLCTMGAQVARDRETHRLTINSEFSATLVLARCRTNVSGNLRWIVRFDALFSPDITVVARLAPGNERVLDYYLLPATANLGSQLRFASHNPLSLEVFHFQDLSFFLALAKRSAIEEAA